MILLSHFLKQQHGYNSLDHISLFHKISVINFFQKHDFSQDEIELQKYFCIGMLHSTSNPTFAEHIDPEYYMENRMNEQNNIADYNLLLKGFLLKFL